MAGNQCRLPLSAIRYPLSAAPSYNTAMAPLPPPSPSTSAACGSPPRSCCSPAASGFGEEYTRVEGFSNRDVGAIVLKGTTREPRLGNPAHRVYETPMGMLNAIGLQNPGVDQVVDRILPALDFTETCFFANVCGSTIDDYVEVTRRFDDSPIDAIELNISCPNIKEGGVQFGNSPEMSARVVEACRRVTRKPLITKLSPNQTDIRENARRCIEAGSDALAVINTVMGMAIDVADAQARHRQHPGRAVGPGDQADRVAQGDAGRRSRAAAGHPDHRPGRHLQRDRRARIHHRRGHHGRCRHVAVLRADVLQAHQRGIADYLAANGMTSVAELIGSLDAPRRVVEACSC